MSERRHAVYCSLPGDHAGVCDDVGLSAGASPTGTVDLLGGFKPGQRVRLRSTAGPPWTAWPEGLLGTVVGLAPRPLIVALDIDSDRGITTSFPIGDVELVEATGTEGCIRCYNHPGERTDSYRKCDTGCDCRCHNVSP